MDIESILKRNKPKRISYYFDLTEFAEILKPNIKKYINKKRKEKEICNILSLLCEMVFYGIVDESGEYHLYMNSLGIDEGKQKGIRDEMFEGIYRKLHGTFSRRINYDDIDQVAIFNEGKVYCGIVRVADSEDI
nr:MAG TPA: hypothetical protein [Caudoviricetes sp.]